MSFLKKTMNLCRSSFCWLLDRIKKSKIGYYVKSTLCCCLLSFMVFAPVNAEAIEVNEDPVLTQDRYFAYKYFKNCGFRILDYSNDIAGYWVTLYPSDTYTMAQYNTWTESMQLKPSGRKDASGSDTIYFSFWEQTIDDNRTVGWSIQGSPDPSQYEEHFYKTYMSGGYRYTITIKNLTSDTIYVAPQISNIPISRSNNIYMIPYYYGYSNNISSDTSALIGIENDVNIDSISESTSALNTKINSMNDFEESQLNNLNAANNAITLDYSLINSNTFISSAAWVKDQFYSLTHGNPFGLIIVFVLTIGLFVRLVGGD